jgi:hypothetical protein
MTIHISFFGIFISQIQSFQINKNLFSSINLDYTQWARYSPYFAKIYELKKFIMQNLSKISFVFLAAIALTLQSCEFIEGIFNVGVAVGILLVVLVVGLIVWIFSKMG